ncbi:MIP/aquaporin family protein [Thermococcus barophilus]|uniref:Glycerol uptake facilitator protein n=1 Tax=Thermococcus barophilus TaxID=55802 RepID=A0A0S1XE27_THEBA|nr:MIP/aquaporin family protein [Thermococcus barophilus]ALM76029.1 glycerol uptake facilitator protein [Thermococcus barophilus]
MSNGPSDKAIFIAEVVGTGILILLGDGVVANVALAPRLAPQAYNWLLIAFGWGFAVAMAVYAAGGISGAHINPAVTIAMAVNGDLPWKKVPAYLAGQFVGAFLGAAGVYAVYYEGLKAAGMPNVWCTGPGSIINKAAWGYTLKEAGASYIGSFSITNAFIAEIIATAMLLIGVYAITDRENLGPGSNMAPWLIGMLVGSIGFSLGGTSGYAINPARDLSPRIFGALVGTKGLFDGMYWIGPPVIGAIIGGILGALIYKHAVKPFLPKRGE